MSTEGIPPSAADALTLIVLFSCMTFLSAGTETNGPSDSFHHNDIFVQFSSRRRDIQHQGVRDTLENPDRHAGCEGSGYCSLGKVKPWQGDVWPSAGLRFSVAARSFKGELIVIGESRVNPFIQAYLEFRRLGLGHIMWIVNRKEKCERASKIFPRELGCGWSSQTFPSPPLVDMHIHRVAYLARALRLGVNVLLIDTDVFIFKDPYQYLKAPPLGDINLMTQRDGDSWVNCGVVYVQNAAPNGPSAYVLAEVVDRSLRWTESVEFLARKANEPPYKHGPIAACWEQSLYTDTLLSALSGRPIFYQCWDWRTRGNRWVEAHARLFGAKEGTGLEFWGSAGYLKQVSTPAPGELYHPELGMSGHKPDSPYMLLVGEMSVPHAKGIWPDDLGGVAFGPRGKNSLDWIAALKEDNSTMIADQDIPDQAEQAYAAKKEKFAYFPSWFVQTWSNSGWTGLWSRALVDGIQPLQRPIVSSPSSDPWDMQRSISVLSHFVHVPGGATNKQTVKMVNMRYNWTAAHAAKAGVGAFFASTPAQPVPLRVVAYSDRLASRTWASEREFSQAILALARVAILSNRTAAFPALRANLSWVIPRWSNDRGLPLNTEGGSSRYICYGKGSWEDVRCLWVGYLYYECQKARVPPLWPGGLLPIEFDHYRDLVASEAGGVPSEGVVDMGSSGSLLQNITIAANKVPALLKDAPRVALLDAIVSAPEDESGPEVAAAKDALILLTGKRCFLQDGRKRRRDM